MMLPSCTLGLMIVLVSLKTLGVNSVKEGTYKKVGDKVILTPGPVSVPITSIKWRHDQGIAVEWSRDKPFTNLRIRDGCTVNTSTGVLTISNLTLQDSGSYTAEINNAVMSTTEILVITTVPQPTVSTWCHPQMTYCILTCEPNITDDAKPITYYWMMGDMVKQSPTNQLNITAKNRVRLISCQLENPVSHGYSKKVINPFTIRNQAFLILPLLLFVAFLFLSCVIWCKCRTSKTRSRHCSNR